jgi:hypothetical protein
MIDASDQLPHGLLLSQHLSPLCVLDNFLLLSDRCLIYGAYKLL